jgi:hypothetical protein
MTEAVKKEYQFQRGNLLLMPYDPRVGGLFNEEALIAIYKRLKAEDLWDIVFHEDAGVTLLKFLNFFSEGRALLQVLAITGPDGFIEPVGVSWIADVTTCSGKMTRGVGSFLFFKDFQKPMYTDQFSEMILDYWFNALGLTIVVGVTPEPNRAALIYVKRAGFKEGGRIPAYTTFKGEVVTGVVTYMTKEDYKQLVGG